MTWGLFIRLVLVGIGMCALMFGLDILAVHKGSIFVYVISFLAPFLGFGVDYLQRKHKARKKAHQ
jgi:hypothetical protein